MLNGVGFGGKDKSPCLDQTSRSSYHLVLQLNVKTDLSVIFAIIGVICFNAKQDSRMVEKSHSNYV